MSGERDARRPVRCPSAACGVSFHVPERQLGRSATCPACGVRLTARPPSIDDKLRLQARRIGGSSGLPAPRLPFVVIADNVRSLWNVGALFRTADAFGVERLYLCGITGCPPRVEIAKTALGAERAVPWEYRADPLDALREVRALGYAPVALEASARAVPLPRARWPRRTCLVVGNEVAGVSPAALEACEGHVAIPMCGVKDSLNVAVAFGIAAQRVAEALGATLPVAAREGGAA